MSFAKIIRLAGLPRELQTVQDNVAFAVDEVRSVPLLDGRLIADVVLASGSDQILTHGLGRTLLGWFPVKRNADVRIWDTAIDASFLTLQTSGAVTVSLWVF